LFRRHPTRDQTQTRFFHRDRGRDSYEKKNKGEGTWSTTKPKRKQPSIGIILLANHPHRHLSIITTVITIVNNTSLFNYHQNVPTKVLPLPHGNTITPDRAPENQSNRKKR
jgi:hypothetical protein